MKISLNKKSWLQIRLIFLEVVRNISYNTCDQVNHCNKSLISDTIYNLCCNRALLFSFNLQIIYILFHMTANANVNLWHDGCCPITVQGVIGIMQRYSLNLNFSFLNQISLFLISNSYLICPRKTKWTLFQTKIGIKIPDLSGNRTRDLLDGRSDMPTTIPTRQLKTNNQGKCLVSTFRFSISIHY